MSSRSVIAHYHPSRIRGLYCVTLIDEGVPRVRIHDRHVLLALTAGEALVWCRGETHALTPGSLLVIEPGDVHRDIRKTPYRAVMVIVHADLMSALRGSDDRRFTSSPVVRCPSLAAEAEALVAGVRAREGLVSQERRLRRLSELLAPLWTREARRPEPPLVARAHRALIETPSAVVSLDELAQRLGCAPTYLCHVFSQHVGLGPHAHQLQHRLLVARRLLERGETVATTAVLTGFGDESHLGRYFRRRFAAGPGRYRQGLSVTDEPSP